MNNTESIIIFGGSGYLGQAIWKELRNSYTIYIVSRKKSTKENYIYWNYEDESQLENILMGKSIIINLAGSPLNGGLWTKSYMKELYDSRINTTRKIANAILALDRKPELLINASAVGYYGNNKEIVNEESSNGEGFLAKLCNDWEAEALSAKSVCGVCILRIGIVIGENGFMKALKPVLYAKIFNSFGNGSQGMAFVSIEDLIGSIKHFCVQKKAGIYNIVSDDKLSNNDFMLLLKNIYGGIKALNIPNILLKLLPGKQYEMFLYSQYVDNSKLKTTNYKLVYPQIDACIKRLKERSSI